MVSSRVIKLSLLFFMSTTLCAMQEPVNWNTTLLKAAASGHEQQIKEALAQKADVNAQREATEETPLLLAALNNQETSVSILIRARANPNIKSSHGLLPIMWALIKK